MSFGSQLRKLRKARGVRQKDVADALRVAQTTIANYEQGIRFPDIPTLHKLVDYFNVSMDLLLGRDEAEPPEKEPPRGDRRRRMGTDADRFMTLLLRGSRCEAEDLFTSRIDAGLPLTEAYLEILQPALREVGKLWEAAEIDVSDEHFFSEAVQDIMAASRERKPQKGPTFLGIAVSGEHHRIGIRMVADFLALGGWNTVNLGGNLPTASLLKALRNYRVDVLGISAAMACHIDAVENVMRAVRADPPGGVKIIVGGMAFNEEPELWRRIGADGYAADAADAVGVARRLVERKR